MNEWPTSNNEITTDKIIPVDKMENEEKELTFEQKTAGALMEIAKKLRGEHFSALLTEGLRWQSRLHRNESDEQSEEMRPRKIGRDFNETFEREGQDGVDGRVETINMGEKDKLLAFTDLHGDEESMGASLEKLFEELLTAEGKVHFVSMGDFATYENNESIEPLKAFLLLEALRKVDLSGAQEQSQSLESELGRLLLETGIPVQDITILLERIKSNLKNHFIPGNGELFIPNSNEVADQLGRTVNVLGTKKATKLYDSLPLMIMVRTATTDAVLCHFLPPLVKEEPWNERGLDAINDENISNLRIEAGVWGGYDPTITTETVAAQAESKNILPEEVWNLGRQTIGSTNGQHDLTEKRVTYSGFPTFQRILDKKGKDKGVYFFGHESALAASGEEGYFTESTPDGSEQIICFHTGGGSKIKKKMLMEIKGDGEITPITIREE